MKVLKRILASVLCAALCFSMTGCYSSDNTWAAKYKDDTMPIGVYIYYLNLAVDAAASKVDSTQEVLKSTIDGKKAEDFILDQAMTYVNSYYWVDSKIKEWGLELDDSEKANAVDITNSMWSYYGAQFEKLGISQSSFTQAYSEYNIKYKKVFDKYYGEGGEFEIPKDDLKATFVANNYSYGYMYASLVTADENGAATEMTAEQKTALTETFEGYKQKIATGYQTLSDAASEYALEAGLAQPQYVSDVSDLKYQYYPSNFLDHLTTMKAGDSEIFESDSNLVLLQKYNIEDAFETSYATGSERLTMLLNLKSDEFTDYVYEKSADIVPEITVNNGGINSIKVSSLISDVNKMGTLKSESTDTASDAASETSSK